jgi:hypothetical protein
MEFVRFIIITIIIVTTAVASHYDLEDRVRLPTKTGFSSCFHAKTGFGALPAS